MEDIDTETDWQTDSFISKALGQLALEQIKYNILYTDTDALWWQTNTIYKFTWYTHVGAGGPGVCGGDSECEQRYLVNQDIFVHSFFFRGGGGGGVRDVKFRVPVFLAIPQTCWIRIRVRNAKIKYHKKKKTNDLQHAENASQIKQLRYT